ncbi:thiamine phosphate synthase [Cohnella thailandensis]|uniref:Thiamine-phosphate synthase n=1 Tax=Cohnella thailandensis TaxID=557557 RepID=A0A841T7H8_9BACL|nr:thiamine phosphate synthase [Cohnella thailandensis]MBB6638218.1 thiamine phosphate synthase [Cohnella thailandensis]MBP1977779.1 thiamine-phosphate pyrophosphorylase [Cohnella thailandensis]
MNATRKEDAVRQALRVYFIMGSSNVPAGIPPELILAEAIRGGATLFQYREKGTGGLRGKARTELAWKLRLLCRERGIPFIVNDDVDLALELDADGVHVGQEDEAASAVRTRIGSKLLGVSAYHEAEAEAAIRAGADYLGVGPIFATRTKEDAKSASGVQAIRRMRELGIRLPIVGIGGITAENAAGVVRAGADGVSVISAISSAEYPREAARRLATAVESALANR